MSVQTLPHQLDVRHVSATYNAHLALEDVSVQIPEGARVAVVGPNGAGKSTFFKLLVGLLPVSSGSIMVHGLELGAHKECVAYVPQREEVDWRFPVTVYDVVMMGRYGRLGWFKRPSKEDQRIVKRCLAQMGLEALADRSIGDLSGGQQQRVFLARALAQEPHILLLDEPFTGVDAATQETTLALIDALQAARVTVIVSTHDLNLAAARFEQVLLLNKKVIAYGPPGEVLTPTNIQRAFGPHVAFVGGEILVDECCPPEEHWHAAQLGPSPTVEDFEK